MKVALLLGNRLNAWHTRLYEPLQNRGVDFLSLTYRPHRYPLEEVRIPYEIVSNAAEQRSLPRRVVEGLDNRVFGTEIDEEPTGLAGKLEEFDLIHTWELFTPDTEAALEAKTRWGTPTLVTVWDNIPFHRDESELSARRKTRARAEADAFLVYTEESKKTLEVEGVEPEKIFLVPPGLDLQEFSPSDRDQPNHPAVILGVGRLVPEKGFEDLLCAVIALRKEAPDHDFKFRLVGEGPLAEKLDAMAESGGILDRYERCPGVPYEKVPDLYRGSDILVLPSRVTSEWKEQFGMALLEAMACGTPVVASRSGGIPEILGEAGLLFSPGQTDELADRLDTLLASDKEWKRYREIGLIRVRERYDAKRNAEDILRIYQHLTA